MEVGDGYSSCKVWDLVGLLFVVSVSCGHTFRHTCVCAVPDGGAAELTCTPPEAVPSCATILLFKLRSCCTDWWCGRAAADVEFVVWFGLLFVVSVLGSAGECCLMS
jgi:hypothetical protein